MGGRADIAFKSQDLAGGGHLACLLLWRSKFEAPTLTSELLFQRMTKLMKWDNELYGYPQRRKNRSIPISNTCLVLKKTLA